MPSESMLSKSVTGKIKS